MKLGLDLSICDTSGPQNSAPAEWAGLTPLVDWNMVDAVVTSGTDIDSVPDASGNGRTLTGVASNKPTLVAASSHFSDQPAAAFSDARRFSHGDLGATTNGPCTIVVVAKVVTDTGNNQYLWRFVNDDFWVYGSMAGANVWNHAHHAGGTELNSNDAATAASVIVSTLSSGTQRLYVNSTTEEGNSASTGADYSGNGVIGNYHGAPSATFTLNGQLARVLVFDKELSADERAACMAALGDLYGVTIS